MSSHSIAQTNIVVNEDDKTLEWSNIGFTVDIKDEKKNIVKKVLLSSNSGIVHGGQIIGIMGGSGAGKSTLLNCLSGRIGKGTLQGKVLFNGEPRNPKFWSSQCSFVEQDDILYTNLTVMETLTYCALLRLPYKMSYEDKMKRVESVIMDLGLDGCRNVRIGNAEAKGISGGERKRVVVAIELISNPDVLFLDEPTSGLDAFTAINLIKTLKTFAINYNVVMIMTIHQPRTDILECLDKILLLSMGKTIWYGRVEKSLDHFASLGFEIPLNTNPSDYFSDISTLDQRTSELKEKSLKRITLFQEAWNKEVSYSLTLSNFKQDMSNLSEWSSPMYYEVFVLLRRAMLDVIRDKATLGATLGQGIFITLVMGFLFFRLPLTASGIQDRLGFLFFICINQTFGIVMPSINVFTDQKLIIKRERAAGTYRSFSAFFAKFLSTLPLTYAGSLLLSIPIYWMVGLQADVYKYLTFIVIVLVQSHTANALGLMIGSFVPSARVGRIIAPLVVVIFLIFGGQFLNLDNVPVSLRWIQYISFISYSNKALSQNEFNGLTFDCSQGPGGLCSSNGSAVLSATGLDNIWLWHCVIINVAISFSYFLIGAICFSKTTAPMLRLESDVDSKIKSVNKVRSF